MAYRNMYLPEAAASLLALEAEVQGTTAGRLASRAVYDALLNDRSATGLVIGAVTAGHGTTTGIAAAAGLPADLTRGILNALASFKPDGGKTGVVVLEDRDGVAHWRLSSPPEAQAA